MTPATLTELALYAAAFAAPFFAYGTLRADRVLEPHHAYYGWVLAALALALAVTHGASGWTVALSATGAVLAVEDSGVHFYQAMQLARIGHYDPDWKIGPIHRGFYWTVAVLSKVWERGTD